MVVGIVVTCVFIAASDDLKIMTMKMERMLSRVVVVQDKVDDIAFIQDEGVGIVAIYSGVCGS